MCYARRRSVLVAALGGIGWGSFAAGAINASWAAPVSDSWTSPTAWTINPTYPDNGQPNPADLYNAIVNVATGTPYTITLPTDITISSLLLNSPDATIQQTGGLLRIVDGGLNINAGKYQMDGGELNTDEAVSVKTRFTWNGGTLSGFGSVEVLSGALLDGSSLLGSRTLSRIVNNAGVINLNGASFSGGTINNLAGGVLNLQDNVTGIGSNNLINNAGLISIDTKPNISFSVPMQNSGTISVNNSLVTFTSGTFTHLTGSVITGFGTVNLGSSGVNHVLAGNLTLSASSITLNGATISGAGNLLINTGLTWNSGTMSGTGVTTVAHGALLAVGGSTSRLARTLNNSGVISVNAGQLLISTGRLNNLADGMINITGGSSTPIAVTGEPGGTFSNAGVININTSSFSTLILPPMVDSGTINVISGGASLSSGTYIYESGATFTGSGTLDLGFGTHIVNGTLTLAGSNMRMGSGTITGIGNINLTNTFAWNGGTIDGAGAMNVLPGANLNVTSFGSTRTLARTINNSGNLNIGSSGSIVFNNGTINNLAGGVITISSTNPFSSSIGSVNLIRNFGVINVDPAAAGSSSGSVTLGFVPFLNSGTINLLSGSLSLGTNMQFDGARINASGFVDLGTPSPSFGTQNLTGPLTLNGPNFNMTSGTLTGNGDLLIRGGFNWNGGTIGGSGMVDVSPSSILNSGSFGSRTLSRTINVAGVMNMGPGSITLNSGTINILPGGTLNLNGFSTSPLFSTTVSPSISQVFNQGQINLGGGTSNITLQSGTIFLVNSGTISVPSGTLLIGGGTYETGAVITGQGLVDLNSNSSSGNTMLNDTLTLNGTNVNMNFGTLSGVGDLAVNGVFNWGGGSLTGFGAVNVASGAAMNVGTSQASRTLQRVLNNSGTLNLNNTSPILVNSGGMINNLPGGIINVSSTFPLSGSGSALLTNSGLMNFNFASLSTGSVSIPLVDSATIAVNSGSLALGTTTFNSGAFLTGAGFIDLDANNASQTVNGTVTLGASTMRLNSGTVSGPGNIVLTSTLNWDVGTFAGTGSMDVRSNAVLNVTNNGANRVLSRTLNNSGTINLLGGQLTLNGGTINNLAGGVINTATLSPIMSILPGGGTNRIVNAGTVNVATGVLQVGVPFSNTGTVIVGTPPPALPGTTSLQFTDIVQQLVAPTLTRGAWIVHRNSTLSLGVATITNNAATVTLDGANSLFPNFDTIATNSGTFSIIGGRTFVTSASYTNSGKTVIGPGSTLHIIGTLSSTGTLDVMGSLIVDGMSAADVFSQIQSGRGDGSWNGAGITSSAAAANPDTSLGFGQVNPSGADPLDGQSGASNSVLVLYTLKGDSNLDGVVNALDFNTLATNFGSSNAGWTDSDYDYSGTVNTADFVALAQNFNKNVASISAPGPSESLGTVVPEPATAFLIAPALFALRRRNRRV